MMLNRCAFESRDLGASFELYSTFIRHFPASLRPLEKQKFGKIRPKMAKRGGATKPHILDQYENPMKAINLTLVVLLLIP